MSDDLEDCHLIKKRLQTKALNLLEIIKKLKPIQIVIQQVQSCKRYLCSYSFYPIP